MWGTIEMNNFAMEYDFPARVVEVIIRKDEKGDIDQVMPAWFNLVKQHYV